VHGAAFWAFDEPSAVVANLGPLLVLSAGWSGLVKVLH